MSLCAWHHNPWGQTAACRPPDGAQESGGDPRPAAGCPLAPVPARFGRGRSTSINARPEPLDDLVDGVRRGDPDAVAAVYLEVAPALRAFLHSEVRHGEVADDLVEHTFVELLEAHGTIRGDGRSLRSWLFRAARHNLYDWRRAAARRADNELSDEISAVLRDPGPDPESTVGAHDEHETVRAALEQLTQDQREVLELRLIAEFSVAEVAEMTGRTEGAVKALQHRALGRLSRVLEGST